MRHQDRSHGMRHIPKQFRQTDGKGVKPKLFERKKIANQNNIAPVLEILRNGSKVRMPAEAKCATQEILRASWPAHAARAAKHFQGKEAGKQSGGSPDHGGNPD